VHVKVTVTGESFHPAEFGRGEIEAVMSGGPYVTVMLVKKVRPLACAEIVAVPLPSPLASPPELIEATLGEEDAQETSEEISRELPSEYLPCTANCWVVPIGKKAFAGKTTAVCNAGADTVTVLEPLNVDSVAVTVVAPCASLVASPVELTIATADCDELQTAVLVKSCVVPSAKLPMADNCIDIPIGSEGLAGVIAIETNLDWVMFTVVEELTPAKLAETVLVPTAWAARRPAELMVATCVEEEVQLTLVVMSAVLPSLYVPMAVYC